MDDLISILPCETRIPDSIFWFDLSDERFARCEDLLLRSEEEWIIRRK
jgi:hypothetical protein